MTNMFKKKGERTQIQTDIYSDFHEKAFVCIYLFSKWWDKSMQLLAIRHILAIFTKKSTIW